MKILATYNIKGGVGKTAAAVNLAYVAAQQGGRILLWDLDPQGAASFYFRIKPKVKGGGKWIIRRKGALDELIKGTNYERLDLLPADFSYRNLDLFLDRSKKPKHQLAKVLKPLEKQYDYVILDCAPSISLTSEAVFMAANALLVPLVPTTLSMRTWEQLSRYRHKKKEKLDHLILVPFFSLVDLRKKMHREIMVNTVNELPEFSKSFIPYSSIVERMGLVREPLGCFARNSQAALEYQALWKDIASRLKLLDQHGHFLD
ncbi:MAG: AAA family ATPase [Gammaproteobacteria bacterium]|nr:AAA family ATPase [Gammaproteobacteria bacterium]